MSGPYRKLMRVNEETGIAEPVIKITRAPPQVISAEEEIVRALMANGSVRSRGGVIVRTTKVMGEDVLVKNAPPFTLYTSDTLNMVSEKVEFTGVTLAKFGVSFKVTHELIWVDV